MPPPDHETVLHAAVLLALRAQAGEDARCAGANLREATDRLAELAGGEGDEEAEEDDPADDAS